VTAGVTHGRPARATPEAPRAASYTTSRDSARGPLLPPQPLRGLCLRPRAGDAAFALASPAPAPAGMFAPGGIGPGHRDPARH